MQFVDSARENYWVAADGIRSLRHHEPRTVRIAASTRGSISPPPARLRYAPMLSPLWRGPTSFARAICSARISSSERRSFLAHHCRVFCQLLSGRPTPHLWNFSHKTAGSAPGLKRWMMARASSVSGRSAIVASGSSFLAKLSWAVVTLPRRPLGNMACKGSGSPFVRT